MLREGTYGLWLEGRLHLLALQLLPVHVAEEAVVPDVSLPLRPAAQPLPRVLGHQLVRGGGEKGVGEETGEGGGGRGETRFKARIL